MKWKYIKMLDVHWNNT